MTQVANSQYRAEEQHKSARNSRKKDKTMKAPTEAWLATQLFINESEWIVNARMTDRSINYWINECVRRQAHPELGSCMERHLTSDTFGDSAPSSPQDRITDIMAQLQSLQSSRQKI
jgi:hypothetical protein